MESTTRPCVDIANKKIDLEDVTWIIQVPFMKRSVRHRVVVRPRARIRSRYDDLGKTSLNTQDPFGTFGTTYRLPVHKFTPVDMCSHSPIGPYQPNDRTVHVQRVKMARRGSRRDTILAIRIVGKGMHWLFVLPKAAGELEPRHVGELRTWRALIPKRGSFCCSPGFCDRGEILENLVRGSRRLRQRTRQCCREEHCAVGGSRLGVQNAVTIVRSNARWLRKRNRALHPGQCETTVT